MMWQTARPPAVGRVLGPSRGASAEIHFFTDSSPFNKNGASRVAVRSSSEAGTPWTP